jgi:aminopeptidase N
MKKILTGVLLLISVLSFSQKADTASYKSWESLYRASATKVNDLVNTKLDVRFDFTKSWMYGKEWVTLHPHFYPTDTLTLDAKKMSILEVAMVKNKKNIPLKYTYDGMKLHITLDKTYHGGEDYTLYINYISKPNDMAGGGSLAITGNKGLYFINPLGKDKDKPTEIWTQGETESNSVWVPTIDKPNQKTTDEISMTVPDKYVTLSNGLLVKSKKNKDGTRTDTWLMDLPHAPYLMMMAVGEYSVIKDQYEGKEVSYYVEKEYAPVARKIFGYTPEMIAFYSRITGVDFPWQKYSQIVVRDYVSGAMENTTATVHGSFAQQDARQLVDGNSWETGIAHELFHQWFGDYVTTESWSNLTMNESFADFSETLWDTYKHGKDAGDEHNYEAMQGYLYSNSGKKDLVRFFYRNREDMFDMVSYQKGGRILNMLKNYVGDSAFYKTLNLYLTTKKFGTAEAHDLRLDFEQVTGQDLNWFFNEWYFGSGHPILDIKYGYNEEAGSATVMVKQNQPDKVFRMPVAVDVYQGGTKKRYKVWISHRADTFSFPVTTRPDLINFDGDKILLCVKTENKTLDNYIFQYNNAGLYLDRREAIEFAAKNQDKDPRAFDFLKTAMNDRYWGLRLLAIRDLKMKTDSSKEILEPLLKNIAENDPKTQVRAAAIDALGSLNKEEFAPLFLKHVDDSSYTIAGSALVALGKVDSAAALKKAHELSLENTKGELASDITMVLFSYAGENDFDELASRFEKAPFGSDKFNLLQPFAELLIKTTNPEHFKKGVDMIAAFRDSIPENIRGRVSGFINGMILNRIISKKQAAGLTDQADYVKSKIPAVKSH